MKAMKQAIWKYVLEIAEEQTLSIPRGAEILSVANQSGELCLWARVFIEAPPEDRTIRIYGTGHVHQMIPGPLAFIGTVLVNGFVWHVFDVTKR